MGRMAGSGTRLLAAAALALALGAAEVRASQVFNLSGVSFSDGGTATGTFTANDALTALLDFNITTSPGTGIGFHYTSFAPATANGSSTSLPFILVLSTPTLDNILQLTFTGLSAAGAPITLGINDSFEQTLTARRTVVEGRVVPATTAAVPEPSTLLPGIVAALAGLGMWARSVR
jgi:hypothetical protein